MKNIFTIDPQIPVDLMTDLDINLQKGLQSFFHKGDYHEESKASLDVSIIEHHNNYTNIGFTISILIGSDKLPDFNEKDYCDKLEIWRSETLAIKSRLRARSVGIVASIFDEDIFNKYQNISVRKVSSLDGDRESRVDKLLIYFRVSFLHPQEK